MAGYRAVAFDARGPGFRLVEIDASDDADALTMAREIAGALAVEIWDALCMIGRFDPTR